MAIHKPKLEPGDRVSVRKFDAQNSRVYTELGTFVRYNASDPHYYCRVLIDGRERDGHANNGDVYLLFAISKYDLQRID